MPHSHYFQNDTDHRWRWQDQFDESNQRDRTVQIVISVAFGFSAFLAFCILRTKWTELYNARKKQSQSAILLPELPKTMFGWIPVVYRITPEEVLASAGLDAFAFLSFFRYAIKYLSITLFFALTIILPVNWKYTGELGLGNHKGNGTNGTNSTEILWLLKADKPVPKIADKSYLWMYVVFAYFFTGVALYLLIVETKYIIGVRQAHLGSQTTVTDRTIRLSGIPADLRSEAKLTRFIEELGIGKVDSVMLCRNWKRLDDMMAERMQCLRRLEEAWTRYVGLHIAVKQSNRVHRSHHPDSDRHETTALLTHQEREREYESLKDRPRPIHTIRYGSLMLKSKKVDAIDYYEEKLRRLDERILILRKQEFQPTPLAFVTMESTAACQMAVQAILDPTPGRLIASLAPPATDVVWSNTYLSRNNRMMRAWSIMVMIGFLSIFWAALLFPLASLLSIEAINEVLPGLADALDSHKIVKSLVQSGLPTLVFTLLSVAVPYVYDWLSNKQGMTSQGDVELSVVSKNFFFTFFNLFIVFTVFGSAVSFFDFWNELQDVLKDTTGIAFAVARSLEALSSFYINLIVLQGFGLFPFRLLEFGSVATYPFYLISAKTPRDHAELAKPPVFQYGFYLPQTMLIFVICLVYSVLPASWLIIFFGLIYFLMGAFIYKYQLLYAMEHRQHSTGQAWPMICNRIILGLIMFHIAMTGVLALDHAYSQSLMLVPLLPSTVWFTAYFQRTYFPLMQFIALRSVDRKAPPGVPQPSESAWDRDTDRGRAVDTNPDTGLRYMNPNLTQPLEPLWIRKTAQGQSPGQEV